MLTRSEQELKDKIGHPKVSSDKQWDQWFDCLLEQMKSSRITTDKILKGINNV